MWGYKPIRGARTPDEEKPTLDQWARQQDETPWLRFSTEGAAGADPGDLTEAVGDGDAVWASGLGMKNLARVDEMLLPAATRPGEPYDDLEELYGRLLGQWVLEVNHVAALVGGFYSQQKHGDQPGVRFTIVPRERQAAAVKFLNEHAFRVPSFAANPEILRRIEPVGVLARVRTSQRRVLSTLLGTARLQRLIEQEALDGAAAYRPADFLADVRRGIWNELDAASVRIDAYRRNLQRAYLDLVNERLNGRQPVADDQRAFYRGELRALDRSLAAALPKAADRETRWHLQDARDQIARALDPKVLPPAPSPGAQGGPGGPPGADDGEREAAGCWPDYAIRRTPSP